MYKIHAPLAGAISFNGFGLWSNMTTYRNEYLTAVLFVVGAVFLFYTIFAFYSGSAKEQADKLPWNKWIRLPFDKAIDATRGIPFEARYIRDGILNLIEELRLVSGKQFEDQCSAYISSNECWRSPERIDLFTLREGKVTVVSQLASIHSALWSIESGFLYRQSNLAGHARIIAPGYANVHDEYNSLLQKKIVYVKTKYKTVRDDNLSLDFKRCAYGLVDIDESYFTRLREALENAETAIKSQPYPDSVPDFRIDYLTNDLIAADIPINGASSPGEKRNPENDAGPTEYFQLQDGRYLRVTMDDGVTLSEDQKLIALGMILAHEKVMEKEQKIFTSLRPALARGGHNISSVRFNRKQEELRFIPERFVAVDTAMGILEIRSHQPFSTEQRKQIPEIAKDTLIRV